MGFPNLNLPTILTTAVTECDVCTLQPYVTHSRVWIPRCTESPAKARCNARAFEQQCDDVNPVTYATKVARLFKQERELDPALLHRLGDPVKISVLRQSPFHDMKNLREL